MKFAFLIHPLDEKMPALIELDRDKVLQKHWGSNPFALCRLVHGSVASAQHLPPMSNRTAPCLVDELPRILSATGAEAAGRIFEIPLDAVSILEQPEKALDLMENAVLQAHEWGAQLVGLGSMTGIVGSRGEYLAQRVPMAVTTGNSLTVYSALQTLDQVVREFDIDLSAETVAIVGIPGSIGTAAAALLAGKCKRLLLVGRSASGPARKIAEEIGGELTTDLPHALSQARLVVSATSTGGCIDQHDLQPGSIVVDIGVPTDVKGNRQIRPDVLILTGGLTRLPKTVDLDSRVLWFQQGMVPSCLGETIVLSLENRPECMSMGRTLSLDSIAEIGRLARSHGFDFSKLMAFGLPVSESTLVRFRKQLHRHGRLPTKSDVNLSDGERARQIYGRYINPVLTAMGEQSGLVKTFVKGDGVWLEDHEGNRYLDFVGGFGSVNLGHNNPAVTSALQQVLASQAPGFAQSAVNPYAAALAERLVSVAPPSLEMAFFCNSGTEAVEAGMKLARRVTGRDGFVHCDGSYHGKSLGALALAGNADYKKPFGTMLPGAESVPYGDLDSLKRALETRRHSAFVVEPLQGEGGMNLPPAGYLAAAQQLCRETGTLFMVDEVQTGLGRTGRLFASEHDELEPDILLIAKSLGGGIVPIGAMLMRRDLWTKAYGTLNTFALHTTTFGGGSLACAAGLATLDLLTAQDIPAKAAERGDQLKAGLDEICSRYNCLKSARGRGLLLGLEFQPMAEHVKTHWKIADRTGLGTMLVPDFDKMVDGVLVMHAMQTLLLVHGIYTQVARSNPRVLRIQPPLTISEAECELFLTALDQTCAEIDFVNNLLDSMIAKTTVGQTDAQEKSRNNPQIHPDSRRVA